MSHGLVDVFAFQEALLIEAVFGLVILTMIWVGFRRWLQHKEKLGRLMADQNAELAAQYGAQMERVEARLQSMEQIVGGGGVRAAAAINGPSTDARPVQIAKDDEA